MITKNAVKDLLNQVLLEPREVSDDQSLFDSGILDSLKTIHLILLIEKQYDITIDQTSLQMEDFESINNLCAYLNGLCTGVK